jgi:peptidoglycan/LPS O-acetylase OafA/YrhL
LARRQVSKKMMWICGTIGAALLVFCFGFSVQAYKIGLGKSGLLMTLVGLGACFVMVAAVTSSWKAPRVFAPILEMGRRSYEIYLTHMFVVIGVFALFVKWGEPMRAVWWMFAVVILVATLLGWSVSVGYSERMNRWLRRGERAPSALEAGEA